MKIEHRIETSLDTNLLTTEAIIAFDKYSISAHNDYYKEERAMRCMEVVLKCIELGMLKNNIAHTLAEIIDKILDKIAKVIKNVKKKLTTGTTFDENLYCIDLKKIFDTSDDKLYNDITYYLDKILSRKKLAAEYCGDMLYVHGWYMADYFNNEFTQNKITSLCEDIKVMYNIKDHIKAAKKNNAGNPEVYPTKNISLSKIKAYLNLNGKFYSTYSDFDGSNKYVCIFD